MLTTASLISALTLASAVIATPLKAVIDPRKVDQPLIFNGISYKGEGCPEGSITTGEMDFVNWQFEIFYANLTASIGTSYPCFC